MKHLIDWWRHPHTDSKLTWGEIIAVSVCAIFSVLVLISAAIAAGWTI